MLYATAMTMIIIVSLLLAGFCLFAILHFLDDLLTDDGPGPGRDAGHVKDSGK